MNTWKYVWLVNLAGHDAIYFVGTDDDLRKAFFSEDSSLSKKVISVEKLGDAWILEDQGEDEEYDAVCESCGFSW